MNAVARPKRNRSGISLIEVIACTAILAVMMVPIAGVIRASAQSFAAASGTASVDARLRHALRWVSQSVRQSEVLTLGNRRLTLQMPDASVVSIEVRGGDLVMVQGVDEIVIAEDIRDVRFQAIQRSTPPVIRTGLSVTLRARDADGNWMTETAVVSHRYQI